MVFFLHGLNLVLKKNCPLGVVLFRKTHPHSTKNMRTIGLCTDICFCASFPGSGGGQEITYFWILTFKTKKVSIEFEHQYICFVFVSNLYCKKYLKVSFITFGDTWEETSN